MSIRSLGADIAEGIFALVDIVVFGAAIPDGATLIAFGLFRIAIW
jgi:hypothetical protein